MILLGLLAFLSAVQIGRADNLFWFSYLAIFLIGIGLLFESSYLIAGQVNIVFLPHLLWAIDFFYQLITREPFIGITDYFFVSSNVLSNFISLSHLFIVPIWIYGLYKLKLRRKDFWILSVVQVSIVYLLTRFLTQPANNINCVFKSCFVFSFGEPFYLLEWFLVCLILIFVTNYMLVNLKIFNFKKVFQKK